MRRLNRKKTLNLMKELDAFPKVPESYVETSASGGTGRLDGVTIMTDGLMHMGAAESIYHVLVIKLLEEDANKLCLQLLEKKLSTRQAQLK